MLRKKLNYEDSFPLAKSILPFVYEPQLLTQKNETCGIHFIFQKVEDGK